MEKKQVIGTIVCGVVCVMLAFAFYGIWSGNIAFGFTKVLCIIACVLFVLLILFARPKSGAGWVRLIFIYLFLACQIAMLIYTMCVRPKYFRIAEGTEHAAQADVEKGRFFIVRETENGKRRLIYASPGDPDKCAWYVVAQPDELYDTALYGERDRAEASAYSSFCILYRADTGEEVDAYTVKSLFPSTISKSAKREFHPSNSDISDTIVEWMKQRASETD